MQNKEHKIDELFQGNLTNLEVNPPPAVWDRISDSMGYSRRRRKALFIWSFSGAASIILAFLLGWYLNTEISKEEQLLAQMEAVNSHLNENYILPSSINQEVNLHFDKPQFEPIYKQPSMVLALGQAETLTERAFNEDLISMNSIEVYKLSNSIKFPEIQKEVDDFFSVSDREILKSNLFAMNDQQEEQTDASWALGVQASPIIRFDQPQLKQLDAGLVDGIQNQLSTTYLSNMSGGISIAYNVDKKFSIISGIAYSELAQSAGDIALSYAGHNWFNDRLGSNYMMESDGANVIASNTTNNLVLNTQVGLANIVLPDGAALTSAKTMNAQAPEATRNYDFKQQARYLEIPMLMRYKIIEKRLGLHLVGGINTNVLVDNSARLEDQNEVLANGKIEGMRPITWSSSLGMGLNYEIANRVLLSLEPTLKIQLNSLNTQQYFDSRPYVFGVFSGISYQF